MTCERHTARNAVSRKTEKTAGLFTASAAEPVYSGPRGGVAA